MANFIDQATGNEIIHQKKSSKKSPSVGDLIERSVGRALAITNKNLTTLQRSIELMTEEGAPTGKAIQPFTRAVQVANECAVTIKVLASESDKLNLTNRRPSINISVDVKRIVEDAKRHLNGKTPKERLLQQADYRANKDFIQVQIFESLLDQLIKHELNGGIAPSGLRRDLITLITAYKIGTMELIKLGQFANQNEELE